MHSANVKPGLWNIDPWIVAYNCRKYNMPVPVMALPFWEGNGDEAFDVSGHGNNGTLVGVPEWVGGAAGLEFNGSSDYITVPNHGSIDISGTNTHISMSAEIKYSTTSIIADKDIFGKWNPDTSQRQYRMDIDDSDGERLKLWLSSDGTNYSSLYGNTDIVDGKLHRCVCTYDGIYMRVYVDGLLDANPLAYSNGIASTSCNLTVGVRSDLERFFGGLINNPILWNACLTPYQVQFLNTYPYFMYQVPQELYGQPLAAPAGVTIPVFMQHYKQMMGA